jgi:hypothetical protein
LQTTTTKTESTADPVELLGILAQTDFKQHAVTPKHEHQTTLHDVSGLDASSSFFEDIYFTTPLLSLSFVRV